MAKIIESFKKINKKILAGAYVTLILIGLVLLISSHYESSQTESMASQVRTADPEVLIAEIPEEQVGKEETRIETLERNEREAAVKAEKSRKDSLAKQEAQQAAQAKRLEQSIQNSLNYSSKQSGSRTSASGVSRTGGSNRRQVPTPEDELTEFDKFKREMDRLDSLEKAGTEIVPKSVVADKPLKSDDKSFFVYKEGFQGSPYFNSIIDTGEPTHIKAMVDQVVKAKQSSRVRLRLLDDITIDGKVIPRNHYLYAHVSGFTGQRIMLTVTSMLLKDKIYPINLEVFDLDGYSGLYVPRSSFQEFMQDFNANAAGSTKVDVDETGTSRLAQMGYDMLDNLISSSRRAIQAKARTNKAKVKYNTQVLLINANERR